MMYMFVGDVVAATINTYCICHTKKFYCQSKHCLYSGLSKLFSQFQKLVLKSDPEFKWLSKVVKTIYMFVGDIVAATINT